VVIITHEGDVSAHVKRVVRLRDGQVTDDLRQAPLAGPPPGFDGVVLDRQVLA
jgi:putative ABC transport system ATP-binding protein